MPRQAGSPTSERKRRLSTGKKTEPPVGKPNAPDTEIKSFPNLDYKDFVTSFDVDWDREESGDFIELDTEKKMIVYLSSDADFALEKIACGDIILQVNGVEYEQSEDIEEIMHSNKKLVLVVRRREKGQPVPEKRAKQICLNRQDGMQYLVITVKRKSNEPPPKGLGFTVKHLRSRMYICAVTPNSVAAQHFAVGDALLDLNGVPVPFVDSSFIGQYMKVLTEKGGFTSVIERPVHFDTVKMLNRLYMSFIPHAQPDLEMSPDATVIGKEASNLHKEVFSKLTPNPVLKVQEGKKKKKRKTVDQSEDEGVKVWLKLQECQIGTSVPDDELEDLRPVKKKDRSRRRHERGSGSLSEIFDLF